MLMMSSCLESSTRQMNLSIQIQLCSPNVIHGSLMVVSRKRVPSTLSSPLLLQGHTLKQVKMFKYHDVLLSHGLIWSEHVQSVCSKARKTLGLLYRRFYKSTFLHLNAKDLKLNSVYCIIL